MVKGAGQLLVFIPSVVNSIFYDMVAWLKPKQAHRVKDQGLTAGLCLICCPQCQSSRTTKFISSESVEL